MRVYGNLMNRISEHTTNPVPTVGMGATVFMFTDRLPATVEKVSPSGKTVWLREDTATRVDTNGMSEAQNYRFDPNPDGRVWVARKRANGTFKTLGTKEGVALGRRSRYYDFSF